MNKIKSRIGDVLVSAGVITQEQLQGALEDQKTFGGRLATILVEKCHISEEQYLEALRLQLKIPAVNLTDLAIPERVIKTVPFDLASEYNVLVYGEFETDRGPVVRLAMSDPTDLEALDKLTALTGMKFEPALALESAIRFILNDYYIIHHGRGDYTLKAGEVPKFCDPDGKFIYGLESSREMVNQSPDPFREQEQYLLREGGVEWASQIAPKGGDRRPTPPRPVPAANGHEVKALVDLLVSKGVISEREYLDQLLSRS